MEIAKIHELFLECHAVCTDTRKLEPRDLFFALKGDNFDGHKFAEMALEMGANYAIIDDPAYQVSEAYILVTDVLKCLQDLAAFHRRYLEIPILSLTGSNGKTTTKELINAVLSKKFKTTATQGNLNNHIGVPLTLLSMNKETELGIVEMGANHHHEIDFLCQIAQPDFGLITNFGKAHLEGFGSLEGVVKAKSELYDYLKFHHKTIFVNTDDLKQLEQVGSYEKIVTFGKYDEHTKIELFDAQPYVSVTFDTLQITSALTGIYNFNNIAASIAIGSYFGVLHHEIKEAIETYVPTNNRSQIILKGSNKILMDAYNANPTSMMAALNNFNSYEDVNKMVILGDMFELGDDALQEHQTIVNFLENTSITHIFLLGNTFSHTRFNSEAIRAFSSFEDFEIFAKEENSILKNQFILIKGSRGMKLERVLDLI
ncbi:UDP-N-acetylmuramoyl-tripeptide--D-alanyl-D-alanine ligase [Mangrovimonas futianensis]|uniref:UDP-N-acetylmuramoyl-tripeptide--D-alanyl-D- alanine ligase n=1 Tax=Mangrovimonas futianensis TaxID=2895523 RepID=UPI001E4710D7|nr:UDP-N-acetylmuramoyl-tripeptide--D-alanyl-D-alanine ligase [Mangrovimonas futianensis]MCF1421158.1 UDP-N-acetylmuramoyl-tripeptide--D-alanyl-D-alanine ligase [Mangrovimonas futianensis]